MIKRIFPSSSFFAGLVCILLLLSSCGANKIPSNGKVNPKLSAKTIIQEHYKNNLQYRTARGKLKVNYKSASANQGFTLSFRMEKDKAIWMNVTLDFAKIYITPGRVAFYNRLENEYFDGDFTFLSNLLGTDLDFQQVQNLLLGQSILNLNEGKYVKNPNQKVYELKPKKAEDLFKILFQIEPKHFKMASQQLSQPSKNRMIDVNYKNYQQISKHILPSEVLILTQDGISKTSIEIEYKNVVFDQKLKFPFKIPKGFKEIVPTRNGL
jgi:hypothetical protein